MWCSNIVWPEGTSAASSRYSWLFWLSSSSYGFSESNRPRLCKHLYFPLATKPQIVVPFRNIDTPVQVGWNFLLARSCDISLRRFLGLSFTCWGRGELPKYAYCYRLLAADLARVVPANSHKQGLLPRVLWCGAGLWAFCVVWRMGLR